MRVVKDPVQFVEGVIESLTHEEAQECFEVYANKIAKLMTEDECKELLKRFLHKKNLANIRILNSSKILSPLENYLSAHIL